MIIDTHCHINDDSFNEDYQDVVLRAKLNNVTFVIVGFNKKTNKRAQLLSDELKCSYTAGIHPSDIYEYNEEELIKYYESGAVAVGECGLDYYWTKDNKKQQKEIFEKQIILSIKYNLPLVIHSRDAMEDTYDLLLKYKNKAYGVMHGFSGSVEMAKKFINLGYKIGIGGPVTFKNAKTPKEVVKEIPLKEILIETDSPYLTPTPFRGKRNEPSYVKYILDEIKKIRLENDDLIEKTIYENSKSLFRI